MGLSITPFVSLWSIHVKPKYVAYFSRRRRT